MQSQIFLTWLDVGKLSVVKVVLQDVVAEVLRELLLIVFLLVCMDELLDFFDVSVESGSLLQSQTLRRSQMFLTKALKLFLRHRLRIRQQILVQFHLLYPLTALFILINKRLKTSHLFLKNRCNKKKCEK